MTTGAICPTPILAFLDNQGNPAVGGSVLTQVGGADAATYQDVGLTSPLPNPIPLNSRGEVSLSGGASSQCFLSPSTVYTFTLYDVNGNQLWVASYVNGQSLPPPPWFVQTAAEIAAGVTPTAYWYQPGDVRRYGADPTGSNDSSAQINAGASCLAYGQSLYFPTGTYLVDSDCIRVTSASDVRIYGDGAGSVIKQSNPGLSSVRITNHSNFVFDQCTDILVENLTIEAKGSQYGDIPGSKPATPDLVVESIANEWGMPIAFTRCLGTVWCRNVSARYPGDNSAFYASSCYRVVFESCFANCASLGYAGFNCDNYTNSSLSGRTYEFYECMSWAESGVPAGLSTTYGSKGGFVTEGDNTKPLIIVISGGLVKNAAIGSDAPTVGTGATCIDCNVTIDGMATDTCYIGINLTKRGGVTDALNWSVAGCSLMNCLVGGIYTAISSATGGINAQINGCNIVSDSSSVWSANTGEVVAFSFGICSDGFMNGTLNIIGCNMRGGQTGYYSIANNKIVMTACQISAINIGVAGYGGGTYKIDGCTIETSGASSIPIYINTANYAASASSTIGAYITGNYLSAAADTTSDYALQLDGNTALFSQIQIKGNVVNKGLLNFFQGSATLFDVDPILLQTTQRVITDGLVGGDTYIEITIPKEYLPVYAYAVGTDSVSRAITGQTNNSVSRGNTRVVVATDVRTQYDASAHVRVTLMQ